MAGLSATIVRSSSASTYAVDLTAKGGADYIVANSRTTYKRKDVTSLFGTVVRTWSFNDNDKNPSGYTITGTDGTPSPASFTITTLYGGYIEAGQYWEITAPAGLAERTLQAVAFSDFGPSFQVQATLSDGSVSPLTLDRNTNGTGSGNYGLYELTYSAGSDGETVTIRITGSGGQINIGWLWLSEEATGTQTLTPSLYTNTNTFYAPTVGRGVVSLSPSLFNNTQTFYAPTVSTTYTLIPDLFTNNQTFFNAMVGSEYSLLPNLFSNTNVFYSPTVTTVGGAQSISPSLFTNTNVFYSGTITTSVNLSGTLFTNTQTFYNPTVNSNYSLLPSLLTNTSVFYNGVVTTSNTLSPSLFTNNNIFFFPTVTGGGIVEEEPSDFYPIYARRRKRR